MTTFDYNALSPQGVPVTGQIEASDNDAAVSLLREQGLMVLNVQAASGQQAPPPSVEVGIPAVAVLAEAHAKAHPHGTPVAAPPPSRPIEAQGELSPPPSPGATPPEQLASTRGISRRDITVLTRQMATTMHAGLPIISILRVLTKDKSNPRLTQVLESISVKIQKGNNLSDALADYPTLFDTTYRNLIRVGEMGGSLPECMGRLAALREKAESTRKKVMAAMAYPSFILVFSLLMTYGLLAFLMPMFTPMIVDAGMDLHRDYPLTYFLMNASAFVNSSAFLLVGVPGVALFVLMLRYAHKVEALAELLDQFRAQPPGLGELAKKVTSASFSRSFSLLLKAGVPLLSAIELLADSSGNRVIARHLRDVSTRLKQGEKLSEAFAATGLFPPLLIQMVTMGEESGSVADLLEKTADYYEEDMDSALAGLTALLEPVMMVLIGGIVAVFVMGVLLPILGLASQKGH